jgi:hypothetical protein
MSNDAEAREVHATVTDSGEPREPFDSDQTERTDRPDLVGADDEVIDADAVIIAEDTGEPNDLDDLDEAADDTHPDTVPAEAIVAEPVPAEAIVAEPVAAEAAAAEPVPASGPGGPRHAAADSGPARPGMPVNGEVPGGIQMAGDPEQLHQRWAAIQSTFVDDPRGSVTSAAALVTEVIDTVVASAKQRENGLRGGWERDGADTEALRNALRGYRALLDQLVAL